jgi:hypothetical protein
MLFFVNAVNEGDYILTVYNGEPTIGDLEAGRLRAQQLLEEYGCRKLLIDITLVLKLHSSVANIYLFVESLKAVPPEMKIGVIIPPEQRWCADFTEKIAANRGIQLKVHTSDEQARLWLLSDSGMDGKIENN